MGFYLQKEYVWKFQKPINHLTYLQTRGEKFHCKQCTRVTVKRKQRHVLKWYRRTNIEIRLVSASKQRYKMWRYVKISLFYRQTSNVVSCILALLVAILDRCSSKCAYIFHSSIAWVLWNVPWLKEPISIRYRIEEEKLRYKWEDAPYSHVNILEHIFTYFLANLWSYIAHLVLYGYQ